jgi:hypothetical protein
MHGSHDKFGSTNRRVMWNWTTVMLTVHAVLFLTLVGLAVGYPGASEWISSAMQAEFASSFEPSVAPKQFAQPVEQIQAMRSN